MNRSPLLHARATFISRQVKCAAFVLLAAAFTPACEREQREFSPAPPASAQATPTSLVNLFPGGRPKELPRAAPYDNNAWAISEGKRLFSWFNCVGCHSHGGGGMGPPLMDEIWIYGAEPENIFSSIAQGRPNGMPAFGTRLNNDDVWKLVSYVRSMSGQQRKDIRPSRSDEMWYMRSEQRRTPIPPRQSGPQNNEP